MSRNFRWLVLSVAAIVMGCSSADDAGNADTEAQDTDTGTGSDVATDSALDSETGDSESSIPFDTDPWDTDQDSISLSGACPWDNRIGGFSVVMNNDFSTASGAVQNDVLPASVPDLIDEEGGCALLKRRNLICDPPCSAESTCSNELVCVPFPLNQDVGTVSIRGLEAPVVMDAVVPGNRYFSTGLPHPAVLPGEAVQMKTPSGFMESVALYGIGVTPLTLLEDSWLVRSGEPLSISWEAPEDGARSEMFIVFNIDQHGASPLRIECVFEDNGQAEVPAALIDQLIQSGISGFPSGVAVRRTADSAVIGSGCADFIVASRVDATVRVDGITPCDSADDCPGSTCDELIGLCG